MELNGDGHIDILSGSYSRQDREMAGLLQVLWGTKDGFKKPEPLNGSDDKPLILPKTEPRGADDDGIIDVICTRAHAADLDGDGHLDLIVGNFRGTFGWFRGEGPGKWSPKATWLMNGDKKLSVGFHSDPCLVDWDQDGDLDLVSGDASGAVVLFPNQGTKTEPKFGTAITLLKAARGKSSDTPHDEEGMKLGDAHLLRPGGDARVNVADVDGDGLLDLLVGDRVTLYHPVAGIDPATIPDRMKAWRAKQAAFFEKELEPEAWQKGYQELEKERDSFAKEEMTGFVWLLRQKPAAR